MRDLLFHLQPQGQSSLQSQIREKLVDAITGGQIPRNERLPSSRQLSRMLGVSRNTVTLAYQTLIDDGFIVARERSGYFVNEAVLDGRLSAPSRQRDGHIDWTGRFRVRPSRQANISKPTDWHRHPFPFIYGQVDDALFPVAEWRDCSRRALGRQWLDTWTADHHASDDAMLVEQIRTRILPRRGILADDDEILITVGAQQALYLVASLFVTPRMRVGIENPGYPDIRNIFSLRTDAVVPLPLDAGGLLVGPEIAGCGLVYTTPSHQAPTGVTMPDERRRALLAWAESSDALIVEDDYELETNFVSKPSPALKSWDRDGRVIYASSLSKTLFPGLRLGFIVADPEVIREARALRRLMVRHPPNLPQRTAALFIALGHYESMLMRYRRSLAVRWAEMRRSVRVHLPRHELMPSLGGSSVWLRGPEGFDANRLAREVLEEGVVLEPGDIYFADRDPPRNCYRLGFSSIDVGAIDEGIRRIAEVSRRQEQRSPGSP
ncbi:MAG: aminotransferase class I/II-fold pyridoxal phosphate-dependent enzyme [Rhizobiales bacterium]|nr:aminotransferase class I/II-fold pyridoxal phosphate-dependent enzyme [Hyphomicrobiales bacterium]